MLFMDCMDLKVTDTDMWGRDTATYTATATDMDTARSYIDPVRGMDLPPHNAHPYIDRVHTTLSSSRMENYTDIYTATAW
jgi:hypothetical protein